MFICIVVMTTTMHIAFSQRYVNTPNDTIYMNGFLEDLHTLSIHQDNITTDTIQFKWKKIDEYVPALWEASNCDNSFCNTTLVDSGTMNPVYPTEYGFLLLHITPHVNYGRSIVRYAVWDTSSTIIDTLTFILDVQSPNSLNELVKNKKIDIYPNPSNNLLSINTSYNDGFEYSILNISGDKIYTSKTSSKNISIITDKFESGIYFLQISKNSIGNYLQFIIKH